MLQRFQRQASSDSAIDLGDRANVSLSSSDSATAIVCLQLKGNYTYSYTYKVRMVIFINIEHETLRNICNGSNWKTWSYQEES